MGPDSDDDMLDEVWRPESAVEEEFRVQTDEEKVTGETGVVELRMEVVGVTGETGEVELRVEEVGVAGETGEVELRTEDVVLTGEVTVSVV